MIPVPASVVVALIVLASAAAGCLWYLATVIRDHRVEIKSLKSQIAFADEHTFTPGDDEEVELFASFAEQFEDSPSALEAAREVNSRAHGVKGWLR